MITGFEDPDLPPPLPQCQSFGCTKHGYIKSERYGMLLCPLHATSGPEPMLCTSGGLHGPFDEGGHCVLCGAVIRKTIQRLWSERD